MTENERIFLDTNILVYAFDLSEKTKHEKCRKIISECFEGKKNFYLSNQSLAEFVSVVSKKIETPLPFSEIKEIIQEINSVNSWKKINYSNKTIESLLMQDLKTSFWDSLIAETMKENNVFVIYTENTKDFNKIQGIKAVNPLA